MTQSADPDRRAEVGVLQRRRPGRHHRDGEEQPAAGHGHVRPLRHQHRHAAGRPPVGERLGHARRSTAPPTSARDAFVSADVNLPNVGKGVDPATLSAEHRPALPHQRPRARPRPRQHQRRRRHDHASSPAARSTPTRSYTFEVTSGVKDTGGTRVPAVQGDVHDRHADRARPTRTSPSSRSACRPRPGRLTPASPIGPDHKLYAGTIDGPDPAVHDQRRRHALGPAEHHDRPARTTAATGTITGLDVRPVQHAPQPGPLGQPRRSTPRRTPATGPARSAG